MEVQKAHIIYGKDNYYIKQDTSSNKWKAYKNNNKKPIKQSIYFSEVAKVVPTYEWVESR